MTTEPTPARDNPTAITARTSGTLRGFELELEITLQPARLVACLEWLKRQGFEPHRRPLTFELTPDGLPICPRHRVPMHLREKQGDTWHSHKVVDPQGRELYCRGYPGPDSLGYDVEVATPGQLA